MKVSFIRTLCAYIMSVVCMMNAGSLFPADLPKGDALINRRVLILDFINVSNSAEYSYLEGSIPEAFLEPLSKTKSFELLLRTTWAKYITQQRFNKEDAFKEETAVEVGKLAGADIVVIGQFITSVDNVQFFSKAIEVSSGKVMVANNSTAPLDSDLFNAIDKMANVMGIEMKNKLPPLPQRVIIEQRIKFADNVKESRKEIIRRAQMEAKAEAWRDLEAEQADKYRQLESYQAMRWRMLESPTLGYKEREALMSAAYRSQPFGIRLFGNTMIGLLSTAAMGLGTGWGIGEVENVITTGISGSVGALLGIGAGIAVTLYDNDHMDDPILGTKLLINSWLWYGFGGLVGAAVGTGIGLLRLTDYTGITVQNLFQNQSVKRVMLHSFATGTILGVGFGIAITLLPALKIIPDDKLKNLIFDINPNESRLGYLVRF